MGEIKSTLDIVLEKTRHLQQTDEERQRQESERMTGRLNGLLQKYVDREVSAEQFVAECNALAEGSDDEISRLLSLIILGRLDIDQDNAAFLQLLDHVGEGEHARTVCETAEKELEYLCARRMMALEELLRSRGIWGTAVKPNIQCDVSWCNGREELRKKMHRELGKEKARIQKG